MIEPAKSNEPHVWVSVHLRGYLLAAEDTGPIRLFVPARLEAALQAIRQQVPGLEQRLTQGSVVLLVNGVNVQRRRGQVIHLADGDQLEIVPFAAGG